MIRRNFLTTSALAATGILACTPKKVETATAETGALADPLVQKAINVLLCNQRMAWEQGTASQALISVGKKDLAILFARDAVVRQTSEGRLGIVANDPGVTDPASNGEAVLLAWKETGDEKYKKAAEAMYNYLKNIAPKTKDGVLHHITYAPQVWSDASFMAPPFLALMDDYDEAVKQIAGFVKYLMDPEKKLLYHQWDESKNEYSRKLLWGGGNGWTAAGIAKIINVLPSNRDDLKTTLTGIGKDIIDGCIAFMRPDGLFHDIIDDSNSFVETNLGQMIAFSIYTGVKSGWLDASYREKADRMRNAARSKVDSQGVITGACGSPSFDKVGTSTEAQSFFIMMESAWHSLQS
ncbi:MAG TPA: glycoside hydrolase family 88 protein [Bacteroidales bacterium]|nr:glycoside hydrolase family 88 protein [Bacteroidales bacterium]